MGETTAVVASTLSSPNDSTQQRNQSQNLRCPCHDFQSMQSMYAAIVENPESSKTTDYSSKNFQRLVNWVNGAYNERARQECKKLHCYVQSESECCIHRAQASALILHALHDSVRPFLRQQMCDGKGDSSSSTSNREVDEDQVLPHLSKDDFPSLQKSVSSIDNSKSKTKPINGSAINSNVAVAKKSKRRIRPVLLMQDKETVVGNLRYLSTDPEQQRTPSVELNKDGVPASVWNRKISDPKPALSSNYIQQEPVIATTTPKKAHLDDTNEDASWKQDTAATLMVTPDSKFLYRGKSSSIYVGNNPSTITTRSRNEAIERIADCPQIIATVAIYTAIVNSCLVPSTVFEIHWLLRLLAISESAPTRTSTTSVDCFLNQQELQENHLQLPLSDALDRNDVFSLILSSPARCRYFAMVSLRNQSMLLQGLGLRVIRDLLYFPQFTQYLPDVSEQLTQFIETYDLESTDIHNMIGSSIIHQTAHLTIPFKPERDSRHNFRTREGSIIYKNREECRDAFLHQLRAFLHMKGKMIDSAEASRVLAKLRHSSKVIVNDLSMPNISWFAEVFIEMILQIGHIPLQETDTELVQTVDKDKLQKLHQRFSSRAPLPSNSGKILSKAIAVDPKRDATTPPIVAAQHYFTGHQEFFFLFMMHADSYVFCMHLRMQFVANLKRLLDTNGHKFPTEKEILDARLLARFLGVLLFCPNWQSLPEISIKIPAIDELNQIAAAGLSIFENLNDGMKNGNLLLSVSWIVELLKMGKWDWSLKDSQLYNLTVKTLRVIQIRLGSEVNSCQSRCQEFFLVRNTLESFFHEVVGLSQIVKLEHSDRHVVDFAKQEATIVSSVIITPDLSAAFAPQLEDVASLITFLSQSNLRSFRSPGVSKKLRPSVVDPSTKVLYSPIAPASAVMQTSIVGSSSSVTATSLSGSSRQISDSFLATLRDNFFHHHGELKLVCDFVAVRILKNLRLEIIQHCVKPLIAVEINNREQGLITIENITKSCKQFLSSKLEHGIRDVVNVLASIETPSVVLDMGIALTVETVHKSGDVIVAVLVEDETTRLFNSVGHNQSKRLFHKDESEVRVRIEQDACYRTLSDMIDRVTENLHKLNENVDKVGVALMSLVSFLNDLTRAASSILPSENSLRQFYFSVLHLDDHSDAVAEWGTNDHQGSKDDRWKVLTSYIEVMFKLKMISHRGLHRLIVRLSDGNFLAKFIELGIDSTKKSTLSEILCQLLNAKLVRLPTLHEALLKSRITAPLSTELQVAFENLSSRT